MTRNRKKHYSVACLAGDGVGPELMGEACRALDEVSRLHGFVVEDVHIPFGSEAMCRFGNSLPAWTRASYLEADALLVAVDGEPAMRAIEADLDLRAAVTRVAFGERGGFRLVHALSGDFSEWTIERAFDLARESRGRLTSIDDDGVWAELVEEVADRNPGVEVEHYSVASGLPALAFEPEGFDVIVSGPLFGGPLSEIAASLDRPNHVVASGRLGRNGPGVFRPGNGTDHEHAGQGVADPSSLLLAVATMLGDGLGEHAAAETLTEAVSFASANGVRTISRLVRGVAASTRQFTDSVLAQLPRTMSTSEFYRESYL